MPFSPRVPVSPATSSPSLYSRPATNIGHSPATSYAHHPHHHPSVVRSRLASRLQTLTASDTFSESDGSYGEEICISERLRGEKSESLTDKAGYGSLVGLGGEGAGEGYVRGDVGSTDYIGRSGWPDGEGSFDLSAKEYQRGGLQRLRNEGSQPDRGSSRDQTRCGSGEEKDGPTLGLERARTPQYGRDFDLIRERKGECEPDHLAGRSPSEDVRHGPRLTKYTELSSEDWLSPGPDAGQGGFSGIAGLGKSARGFVKLGKKAATEMGQGLGLGLGLNLPGFGGAGVGTSGSGGVGAGRTGMAPSASSDSAGTEGPSLSKGMAGFLEGSKYHVHEQSDLLSRSEMGLGLRHGRPREHSTTSTNSTTSTSRSGASIASSGSTASSGLGLVTPRCDATTGLLPSTGAPMIASFDSPLSAHTQKTPFASYLTRQAQTHVSDDSLATPLAPSASASAYAQSGHQTLPPSHHSRPTPQARPFDACITPAPAPLPTRNPSLRVTATEKTDPSTLAPSLFALSPNPHQGAFQAADRPLLSSGSPGFGLISLETAQERERERAVRKATARSGSRSAKKGRGGDDAEHVDIGRDPTAPPSPPSSGLRLRGKKSLMKLFKGERGMGGSAKNLKIGEPMPMSMAPVLPEGGAGGGGTPRQGDLAGALVAGARQGALGAPQGEGVVWPRHAGLVVGGDGGEARPKLELRPVSMTFANGLPSDYLSPEDEQGYQAGLIVRPATASGSGAISDERSPSQSPSSTLAPTTANGSDGWASRPTSVSTGSEYSRPSGEMSRTSSGFEPDFTRPATAPSTSTAAVGTATEAVTDHSRASFETTRTTRSAFSTHMGYSTHTSHTAYSAESQVPPLPTQKHADETDPAAQIREQLSNARKAWRVQLYELSSQIRELRDELDAVRSARAASENGVGCEACGCGCERGGGGIGSIKDVVAGMRGRAGEVKTGKDGKDGGVGRARAGTGGGGIMDRGRVKTAGARGVFGTGSLYEWE